MILEVALLNIRPGLAGEFEAAFRQASPIIRSVPGYISHDLERSLETANRYTLLVRWETVEAHTVGFRGSPQFVEWLKLLHHFYDPPPAIEHYQQVDLTA